MKNEMMATIIMEMAALQTEQQLKQVGFVLEVQLLQETNVLSVRVDGIKTVQQILQLE